MFLIRRNIDMDIYKMDMWIDDTPVPQRKGRPSGLLMGLMTRI